MKNLLVIMLLALMACNSQPKDMVEVKGPFDSKSYKSNNRYFRAVASGESQNLETSKSKARLVANQRLASAVQTEIKMVSESYQNERNVEKKVWRRKFCQFRQNESNKIRTLRK